MNDGGYPVEPDPDANTIDARLRQLTITAYDINSKVCSIGRFTVGFDVDTMGEDPERPSIDGRLDSALDVLQRSAMQLQEIAIRLGVDDFARRHDQTRTVASR